MTVELFGKMVFDVDCLMFVWWLFDDLLCECIDEVRMKCLWNQLMFVVGCDDCWLVVGCIDWECLGYVWWLLIDYDGLHPLIYPSIHLLIDWLMFDVCLMIVWWFVMWLFDERWSGWLMFEMVDDCCMFVGCMYV